MKIIIVKVTVTVVWAKFYLPSFAMVINNKFIEKETIRLLLVCFVYAGAAYPLPIIGFGLWVLFFSHSFQVKPDQHACRAFMAFVILNLRKVHKN